MAPALSTIQRDLDMSNIEAVMALSIYLLATAFGPLLIGPLSEVYGRKPILHASNIWFLVWNIACGFANSKGLLIGARFLAGFGASAIYALAGGVLGDIYSAEERGKSLGIYILVPLLAAAIGPILGGFITEHTTWRWMFWATSILQAFMIAISLPIFKETHEPTILARKAQVLRKSTEDPRYETRMERLDAGQTPTWILVRSLTRPLRLLAFHPIVQVQALYSAFSYGILYLTITTFSTLFTTQYHETLSISALHYFAPATGEIVGALTGAPLLDTLYLTMKRRSNGISSPEHRVPMMIPGAILVPLGLILYGWCAQYQTHWIFVDIGAFLLSLGMQIGGQAMQAYVMDSYTDHTSSALAASQFLRSLTAFGFPLFAPIMYERLGYGWGNSLLAFLAVGIGIPAPLLIWRYGARLRAKAESSY